MTNIFSTADIANIQIASAYAIHLFCRPSRVVVRALIELQTFASAWRQGASFADELRVERGALQKLYLKVQNSTNTQHATLINTQH